MNRLAHESSPYLLQHAGDPVDWWPWSPHALAMAARQDKPVFLSIGYSASHACQSMGQACFADPVQAELLNRHFVSILVDRDERPDLDRVYQCACLLLGHSECGWPLSVFLTPAGIAPRRHKPIETTDIMLQMVASGRGVAALPRWLALEYAEKMAVVPVKLGSKGIAKQIYLGAREAELHTDYLQAFIALARAPGLALPAAAPTQKDS